LIQDRTGVPPEEQVLIFCTRPIGYNEETLKMTAGDIHL